MKTPKYLPKLNTKTPQKPDSNKPLTPERAKEIIDEVWSKKRFVNGFSYTSLDRERS